MKFEEQEFGMNKRFTAHDNSHTIIIGERTQIVDDKDGVIYDFQTDGDWKQKVREAIEKKDKEMTCAYGYCYSDCSHVSVARAQLRQLKEELGL